MSNPILEFVRGIAAEGLHPHAVAVEQVEGRWQCRVELDDWCALGDGGDTNVQVTVDRDSLPPGVKLRGRERFAPRVMPLELPTRTDIERWMMEVAAVGKAPDFAWLGGACCLTKPVEWMREPMRSKLLGGRQ